MWTLLHATRSHCKGLNMIFSGLNISKREKNFHIWFSLAQIDLLMNNSLQVWIHSYLYMYKLGQYADLLSFYTNFCPVYTSMTEIIQGYKRVLWTPSRLKSLLFKKINMSGKILSGWQGTCNGLITAVTMNSAISEIISNDHDCSTSL